MLSQDLLPSRALFLFFVCDFSLFDSGVLCSQILVCAVANALLA